MRTNKESQIQFYLSEVESYLPYAQDKKNQILIDLEGELKDALRNEGGSPIDLFGTPRETAINLVQTDIHEFERASWLSRLVAYGIDTIFIFGLVWIFLGAPILIWEETLTKESGQSIQELIIQILFVFYGFGTFVVCFSLYFVPEKIYGHTLGKKLLGLKTVDKTGVLISWRQSIVRNVTKFQIQFFWLDFFMGLLMKKEGQSFLKATDIISETMVVKLNKYIL